MDKMLPQIPSEYRVPLSGLPRCICIYPRGGRHSPWKLSFKATIDDWRANVELRDTIAEFAAVKRRQASDVVLLLSQANAESIEGLVHPARAA